MSSASNAQHELQFECQKKQILGTKIMKKTRKDYERLRRIMNAHQSHEKYWKLPKSPTPTGSGVGGVDPTFLIMYEHKGGVNPCYGRFAFIWWIEYIQDLPGAAQRLLDGERFEGVPVSSFQERLCTLWQRGKNI